MQNLETQPDFDTLMRAEEAVLLKHGATCPVSAHAREELSTFAASHPDVTVCALEVTAHGDLSKYAAERLGVEHESPQVILIRGGQAAWHSEHFAITAVRLGAQLKR
jgi:bacillithiol system protein YtxJ